MSALGMGIAAGVAQANVQAAQVNRAQHRQQTDSSSDARRVRQRIEAHLNALDEGDEANLISEVRIDDQMPDGHRHDEAMQQQGGKKKTQDQVSVESLNIIDSDDVKTPPEDDGREHLYKHLDVTG